MEPQISTSGQPPLAKDDDALDETARQILDAASKRFLHYGYNKTTMSEIAKDCNMSTGNLYRYFPAKMDIAEAFVGLLRREHIIRLRLVVEDPQLTPRDKLRAFLHTKVKATYDRFHDRPRAYELSAELIKERHNIAEQWERAEGELIERILEMGNQQGCFYCRNTARLSRIIQDMVFRFSSASVFHEGDYEQLSGELNDIIDILLDAMAWRQHNSN